MNSRMRTRNDRRDCFAPVSIGHFAAARNDLNLLSKHEKVADGFAVEVMADRIGKDFGYG